MPSRKNGKLLYTVARVQRRRVSHPQRELKSARRATERSAGEGGADVRERLLKKKGGEVAIHLGRQALEIVRRRILRRRRVQREPFFHA